jgi:hypothetical protein
MTMSMEGQGVPVRRTCPARLRCECAGCARVAAKLRSLRAAEIDELSYCAPSMRQAGSAEEPMRLLSPHACRCTCWEAGDGYVRSACSASCYACMCDRSCRIDRARLRVHDHDHVLYRCRSLCVCVTLERGWRGRNAHGRAMSRCILAVCLAVYTSYDDRSVLRTRERPPVRVLCAIYEYGVSSAQRRF